MGFWCSQPSRACGVDFHSVVQIRDCRSSRKTDTAHKRLIVCHCVKSSNRVGCGLYSHPSIQSIIGRKKEATITPCQNLGVCVEPRASIAEKKKKARESPEDERGRGGGGKPHAGPRPARRDRLQLVWPDPSIGVRRRGCIDCSIGRLMDRSA